MSSASGGAKWKCQHCLAEIQSGDAFKFCFICGKEQFETTTPLTCGNPECSNQVSSGSKYCGPCSTIKTHKLPDFEKAPRSVSSTAQNMDVYTSGSGQTRYGDQSTIGDGQV